MSVWIKSAIGFTGGALLLLLSAFIGYAFGSTNEIVTLGQMACASGFVGLICGIAELNNKKM